jgi:hypothetical protein
VQLDMSELRESRQLRDDKIGLRYVFADLALDKCIVKGYFGKKF